MVVWNHHVSPYFNLRNIVKECLHTIDILKRTSFKNNSKHHLSKIMMQDKEIYLGSLHDKVTPSLHWKLSCSWRSYSKPKQLKIACIGWLKSEQQKNELYFIKIGIKSQNNLLSEISQYNIGLLHT